MKSIFITCPAFGVHGGIRVILEWASRLSRNHRVWLRVLDGNTQCDWFKIPDTVEVIADDSMLPYADLVIVTSPHAAHYLNNPKTVVFLQMLEHMFVPGSAKWLKYCMQTYRTPNPMITLTEWGKRQLHHQLGRKSKTDVIGNGVNLEHFPIDRTPKDGKTILVEGWVPSNATKDVSHLGPLVARVLKSRGCTILAYSGKPIGNHHPGLVDEYFYRPTLAQLNALYQRATVLVKATRFDFRACAPMEAMTKGTVTSRAIIEGDDDLIHDQNCLRSGYQAGPLLANTIRLLEDTKLRERLSANCLEYVQKFSWDFWMEKVEELLWSQN